MRSVLAALLAAAAFALASPVTAENRDLAFQRLAAEFFAESDRYDAWSSREVRKCKMLKSGAEERACFERLQPQLDRRKCEMYARFDREHGKLMGRGHSRWKPGPECRPYL